ncbi:porin family protein [Paraglaciecola hydrolytica]|uniref:Topoisomerase IV n=1 Tax=Paraglaciecola hydrolytica TaxID=1799789 RepID=A0A136A6T3_9ALTE|nr:hypothetical protein [Paraglaciecola hydrolytica]KXI30931.1 hypothetical protein AX660_00220 [Paraglaciecola hydrolytica]
MKKIFVLSAIALASFTTQADVRINGFANLIGGITTSDKSLYGYDDKISFSEESLFAIQVSGDINNKMTATAQLVARGQNDYDPDFEWAYMTYKATDNLSVSVGRLRLPLFNYSASKDVGYSYHWLNTPRSVYDVPFNNLDGIRFDYSNYTGDWEYNLSVSSGAFTGPAFGTEIKGDNVVLLSAEASYEWFKIRGVAGSAKTSLDMASSTSGSLIEATQGLALVNAFGFSNLVDSLQWNDDTGEFYGLSLQVDKFDWFISAEMTQIDVAESFIAKTDAYYVTAGLRIGAWTPSVTYEKSKSEFQDKFQPQIQQMLSTQFSAGQVAAFAATPIGSLVDMGVQAQTQGAFTLTTLPVTQSSPIITSAMNDFIVQGLLNSTVSENSVLSASLRYDYDTNIALKFDVTKYTNDLSNSDVTLVRFGVNYVF